MDNLPLVTIVGRPNVGKSSLLNLMVRRRVAIVDATAGTTRDRVEVIVRHRGRRFRLVDTGGMGIVDRKDIAADVERQINHAIEEADLILFVTDVRTGMTPGDRDAANRLRPVERPIILVVNKCDTGLMEDQSGEFYRLGFGEPMTVSAKEGYGREELLDLIVREIPKAAGHARPGGPAAGAKGAPEEEVAIKVAIVGRRNVGKSTFINRLVGSDRLITSDIPGTTRDAVDVPFEFKKHKLIAIDTAGMRKKRMIHDSVEFYSTARTERSIRRADVVFLMLDAATDIGRVDKKLASYILSQFKPVIIVVNKWDLAVAKGMTPETYFEYIAEVLHGLDYAPISFLSAKDGFNVEPTMELVYKLYKQANTRVTTGQLNRVIQEAVTRRQPPKRGNRTLNVYYATQVEVAPPHVVVFVNDADMFDRRYIHYLANVLREHLPFDEVPVKIEMKTRERSPSKRTKGFEGRRGPKKGPGSRTRGRKPKSEPAEGD